MSKRIRSARFFVRDSRGCPESAGANTFRVLLGILGSTSFGTVLLVALCFWSGLDLTAIENLILAVNPTAFGLTLLLMSVSAALSGEKWRLVVSRLDAAGTLKMPPQLCFALSALGTSLGQFLPNQISTALVRTIGARAYGSRAVQRGTGATLFEQAFDLLAGVLFGLATVLVIFTRGNAMDWAGWAVLASAAGFGLCWFMPLIAASVSAGVGSLPSWLPGAGLKMRIGSFAPSLLLAPVFTCRLFALSVLRLGAAVLVGLVSANAFSSDILPWQLAAALPFSAVAAAFSLTPGAIGVSEWTVTSVLVALGTSVQVAAQWAVATRILVAAATAVLGVIAVFLIGLVRWSTRLASTETA